MIPVVRITVQSVVVGARATHIGEDDETLATPLNSGQRRCAMTGRRQRNDRRHEAAETGFRSTERQFGRAEVAGANSGRT